MSPRASKKAATAVEAAPAPAAQEPEPVSARNSAAQLLEIETNSIAASNLNPRKWIQAEPLDELAESIREYGILEPLVLRPITPAGAHGLETPVIQLANGGPKYEYKYELVAGERRWRAARNVGLATVPAIVRTDLEDDSKVLELMLVENLQRADLNPMEEAEAYARLRKLGMRQTEIAERIHKSQPAVANTMVLLELPQDVRLLIRDGKLSASHGKAIASWKHLPAVASKLAEVAVSNGWTSKQTENPFSSFWVFFTPLQNAKLVRDIYEAVFDRAICQSCPHDAYRNPGRNYGLCFKPEHFDELQAVAVAERDRRLRESTAVLKISTGGKSETAAPSISDLAHDTYERIEGNGPPQCQPECPSRGRAKGYDGRLIPICLDPKCHKRLSMAETKRKNKSGRELMRAMLADLEVRVDRLRDLGPREMAVIGQAIVANDYHLRPYLRQACERQQQMALWNKLDGGYSTEPYRCEALEGIAPLAVARVIVEGFCRMELMERYQERRIGHSSTADWYLEVNGPTKAESPAEGEIAESPESPNGRCREPAVLAFRWKCGGVSGTSFACELHAMTIADELQEGYTVLSEDVIEPSAVGKLVCSYVAEGGEQANGGN